MIDNGNVIDIVQPPGNNPYYFPGINIHSHLRAVIPFLELQSQVEESLLGRGVNLRRHLQASKPRHRMVYVRIEQVAYILRWKDKFDWTFNNSCASVSLPANIRLIPCTERAFLDTRDAERHSLMTMGYY